jgi:hypothetical protein
MALLRNQSTITYLYSDWLVHLFGLEVIGTESKHQQRMPRHKDNLWLMISFYLYTDAIV